jgi:hypothetical protein
MTTELFPGTGRYVGIETAMLTTPDGEEIAYLRRRWVPSSSRFAVLEVHRIVEGERVDRFTARYLGDPLQFWRICDANDVMRPEELTERVGRPFRITLPEGIPGAPDA